jgi:hypothetical protein
MDGDIYHPERSPAVLDYGRPESRLRRWRAWLPLAFWRTVVLALLAVGAGVVCHRRSAAWQLVSTRDRWLVTVSPDGRQALLRDVGLRPSGRRRSMRPGAVGLAALCEPETDRVLWTVAGTSDRGEELRATRWSVDGSRLLLTYGYFQHKLVDARDGRVIGAWRAYNPQFTPDLLMIAFQNAWGGMEVRRCDDDSPVLPAGGMPWSFRRTFRFSTDGRRLMCFTELPLVAGGVGRADVWGLNGRSLVFACAGSDAPRGTERFDGRLAAMGIETLDGSHHPLFSLPGGRWLWLDRLNERMYVREASGRTTLLAVDASGAWACGDGSRFCATTRGKWMVWDARTLALVGEIPLRDAPLGAAAWAPDGSRVAFWQADRLEIWRGDLGARLAVIGPGGGLPADFASRTFLASDRLLLTFDSTGKLRVWRRVRPDWVWPRFDRGRGTCGEGGRKAQRRQ